MVKIFYFFGANYKVKFGFVPVSVLVTAGFVVGSPIGVVSLSEIITSGFLGPLASVIVIAGIRVRGLRGIVIPDV
jgi:hypothetical protein